MTAVVELRGVVKDHPGPLRVLNGIDLSIAAGELVGIVGPSGSGKTTLLQIMGTLDSASAGQARIAGTDVSQATDRELASLRARELGFVFQRFHLLDGVSAIDNVASGLIYRGVPLRHRRRLAAEKLDRVGLGHRLEHPPAKLSGGECQRVAVARALMGEPSLVLADEPTGNLDSVASERFLEVLQDLNSDGVTIVVVTHDLEIAEALPRTVGIRDGEITEDSCARDRVSAG
jgi:putative ABC transport system ATP-binding protein